MFSNIETHYRALELYFCFPFTFRPFSLQYLFLQLIVTHNH